MAVIYGAIDEFVRDRLRELSEPVESLLEVDGGELAAWSIKKVPFLCSF